MNRKSDHFHEEHRHRRGNYQGRGAKTFRRGRALEFLNRMELKRLTLKQQLQSQELQSIEPILVGELKAIELVIEEFKQLFDIHPEEIKPEKEIENHNN